MPTAADVSIRRAEPCDIPALVSHHRRMFEEIRAIMNRTVNSDQLAAMDRSYRDKLLEQIPIDQCAAWVAQVRGKTAASGALSVTSQVPIPEDPGHLVGYFHSLYTEKTFRRMGLARIILEAAKAHADLMGIRRVQLGTSDAGRSLYESAGFSPMVEAMRWWRR
ncbi:MAG: GNAT family N-acetyltransferase [Proteobacteria bacterium]|nr:GNAT family N-acetyltransferase [Pseudomonadota bacterium]